MPQAYKLSPAPLFIDKGVTTAAAVMLAVICWAASLSEIFSGEYWSAAAFASLVIITSCLLFFWTTRLLFKPSVIVLGFLLLLNVPHVLLLSLGVIGKSEFLGVEFSADAIVWLCLISATAVSGYVAGALVAAFPEPTTAGFKHVSTAKLSGEMPQVRMLLIFSLLALSGAFYGLHYHGFVQQFLETGRSGLFKFRGSGIVGEIGIYAADMFPIICLLLMVATAGRKVTIHRVAWALLILNSLMQLYVGSRGAAILPILAAFWLQHELVRPIKAKTIILASALVLFLIAPLIGVVRNQENFRHLSIADIKVSDDVGALALNSLLEAGRPLRIIGWVRESELPEEVPNGRSYLGAIAAIFPNLGGGVHWSVGDGTLTKRLEEYVRRDVFPWKLRQGWGFSFVAEAFLSFSYFGVLLVPFGLGFVIRRFEPIRPYSGGFARYGIYAAIIVFMPIAMRGEMREVVRPVVWFAVVPIVVIKLLEAFFLKLLFYNRASITNSEIQPLTPRAGGAAGDEPRDS